MFRALTNYRQVVATHFCRAVGALIAKKLLLRDGSSSQIRKAQDLNTYYKKHLEGFVQQLKFKKNDWMHALNTCFQECGWKIDEKTKVPTIQGEKELPWQVIDYIQTTKNYNKTINDTGAHRTNTGPGNSDGDSADDNDSDSANDFWDQHARGKGEIPIPAIDPDSPGNKKKRRRSQVKPKQPQEQPQVKSEDRESEDSNQ